MGLGGRDLRGKSSQIYLCFPARCLSPIVLTELGFNSRICTIFISKRGETLLLCINYTITTF